MALHRQKKMMLQKNNLRAAKKGNCKLHHRAPLWPEIEEQIKTWVGNERSTRRIISTKRIRNEARILVNEKGIQNFIETEGWCYRFMKREVLSRRIKTSIAQRIPANYDDKIVKFHKFVIRARKRTSFELGQIENMDEVPLTFDVPPNKIVCIKGSKIIRIKPRTMIRPIIRSFLHVALMTQNCLLF